jgi:Dolichyl-phosphate-mannose-protein mannosyltransferase
MASQVPTFGRSWGARPWRGVGSLRWTGQAWGAIGATTLFLAISCWWLTQDRSIPVFDAGRHLSFAFSSFEALGSGRIVHALTLSSPYPPFAYVVGDLGILLGGIDVAPPIVAENFVFVPLLALGCYHVGRLAFDRTAGLLAVLFALGSPLITAQFHVFMTDAPETAMVALSLWAILATEGFSRVGTSALAGIAVGAGLLTKEPFVFYAAGPVIVTALRGGPRAWRGMLMFALVVLVIALPWYAHELSHVTSLGTSTLHRAASGRPVSDIRPLPISVENFEWYFWNMVNFQLYLPLFAFAVVGFLWTMAGFVRRRPVSRLAAELATGSVIAWLAITETFPHDTRYSMPLLVYLAVFGVGWIARLPRAGFVLATAALSFTVAVNTAGSSFGIGQLTSVTLPGANASSLQHPGELTLFSNRGFLVSGPNEDGDLLATLRALRRNGVRVVVLEPSTVTNGAFSALGLIALDEIAKLETYSSAEVSAAALTRQVAVFHNAPIGAGESPPCLRLANGTGVWIRLGNPDAPGVRDYCPSRDPSFYR